MFEPLVLALFNNRRGSGDSHAEDELLNERDATEEQGDAIDEDLGLIGSLPKHNSVQLALSVQTSGGGNSIGNAASTAGLTIFC